MAKPKSPVVIELENRADVTPATAPPVPEDRPIEPTSAQKAIQFAARHPSRLARLFWACLSAFLGFVIALSAWDYATALLQRNSILGSISVGLLGVLVLVLILIALREMAALARLSRVGSIRRMAKDALALNDLKAAKRTVKQLDRLYAERRELDLARQKVRDHIEDVFDAEAVLNLAECEILKMFDQSAQNEIEAAARSVATITAFLPLALLDVLVALTRNLRMIRRIAEIYGGRAGLLGSWRLTRAVMAHLLATGAVAVGDDMIGSLAGGGVLAKVSRRFGEGVINGALTARVGIAALEVCRPLPFQATKKPKVTTLLRRALSGVFGSDKTNP